MGRWGDYQAERAQRKAGETETGKKLIGQRELVWAKLTDAKANAASVSTHLAAAEAALQGPECTQHCASPP